MTAKMTPADIEAFLHAEFPQAFRTGGDISIESADGRSCRMRQRFNEHMLRPGGTVSGPTLMALADFAMYVVLLSAIGPVDELMSYGDLAQSLASAPAHKTAAE